MTITIALPSKGRLKEKALEVFAQAGFRIELPKDSRSYRGSVKGRPEIEIAFLSASEIARELIAGKIALGVTGEDLARESVADPGTFLDFACRLGFGGADVVVAVPDAWADVTTMADLDDVAAGFRRSHHRPLRVATKYWQLTQNWFADHGIALYRIAESLGATEGAPAAGTADIIVDITSTGSTLKANHLRILRDGIILRSQANLIASKKIRLSREDRAVLKGVCRQVAEAVAAN
ncbi:ATP phosphoribosyltransferase [Salaquimonas pukyongi]|uniref:ATP phosphoribosyltransferase n=1 Tax=Salaquimonas pukyongi TaxID=2712698 RepID=UPI00096B9626|nr:ATP phosphoribosyltransferase [Salaquimonas pukyongi]